MLFADIRFIDREGAQIEANLGLGMRWLSNDLEKLYGLYLFYDSKRSKYNNMFNQLTIGGEFKRGRFSLGTNAYIHLGNRTKDYKTTENNIFAPPYLSHKNGNEYSQIVVGRKLDSTYYEEAMVGFDGEIGFNASKYLDLTLYAGGFYLYQLLLSCAS